MQLLDLHQNSKLERDHQAKKGAALLADDYEAYEHVAAEFEMVHLRCWVHARRRFVETEAALPKSARTPD